MVPCDEIFSNFVRFFSQVNNFTLIISLGQQYKLGLEYMIRNNVDIWTDPKNRPDPFPRQLQTQLKNTHTHGHRKWPSEFDFPFQQKKELRTKKGMFIDLLSPSMFFVLLVFGFKLKSLFFCFSFWWWNMDFRVLFSLLVFKTVIFLPLF